MKTNYRQLERVVRGVSCHRRIQILELLVSEPGMSLKAMSQKLRVDFKVISEHTQRLAVAGHIEKRPRGREVLHTPTSMGIVMLDFLRALNDPG